VSLQVRRSEISTVLGSNGAGKTTILKTISGIIDPRKGSVLGGRTVRNRLRRLLHRHLLSLDPTPLQPSWVVLSLKPGSAELDPAQLLGECSYLLRQAGLTK
jgi:ABC-type cobalamin/Fe3+-siderophores transport system ATPase subunit